MNKKPELWTISFRTEKSLTWADAKRVLNSICQRLRRSPYQWKLYAVASDVSYTAIKQEARRQVSGESRQERRSRLEWFAERQCRRSIHFHMLLYCNAGDSGRKLVKDYLSKNRLLYKCSYREKGKWKHGQGTIKIIPLWGLDGWIEELDGNYKYSSKRVRRLRQSDEMKQITFSELATKLGVENRLPPVITRGAGRYHKDSNTIKGA